MKLLAGIVNGLILAGLVVVVAVLSLFPPPREEADYPQEYDA